MSLSEIILVYVGTNIEKSEPSPALGSHHLKQGPWSRVECLAVQQPSHISLISRKYSSLTQCNSPKYTPVQTITWVKVGWAALYPRFIPGWNFIPQGTLWPIANYTSPGQITPPQLCKTHVENGSFIGCCHN